MTKDDLRRSALDLVRQLTPTQDIYKATSHRSKELTGRTLSQARKADLERLVQTLRTELKTLEATEVQDGPYLVVWLDGITNSKVYSGPYMSQRAALAEAQKVRALTVRHAQEISWQGPVNLTKGATKNGDVVNGCTVTATSSNRARGKHESWQYVISNPEQGIFWASRFVYHSETSALNAGQKDANEVEYHVGTHE